MKYQLLKLLRSPAGAKQVATGFAIGFGLEMLLPYTLYIGYILMAPFIFLKPFRGLLPPVVVGNVIGKVSLLPALLVPLAIKVSHQVFAKPRHVTRIHEMLMTYQRTLLVLSGFGVVLGIVSYYLVYFMYQSFRKKRMNRRKERRLKQTHGM